MPSPSRPPSHHHPTRPRLHYLFRYRVLYYVYLQGNKKYQGGSADLADIMKALRPEAFSHPAVAHALKVRRWPAWTCPRYPCIDSHPGTPTLSLSLSLWPTPQVRRWPAWTCPIHPCIGSHPGAPTPPLTQLFSFFNAGDMDGVRRVVAGHFAGAPLARLEVRRRPCVGSLPGTPTPFLWSCRCAVGPPGSASTPLCRLTPRHTNPLQCTLQKTACSAPSSWTRCDTCCMGERDASAWMTHNAPPHPSLTVPSSWIRYEHKTRRCRPAPLPPVCVRVLSPSEKPNAHYSLTHAHSSLLPLPLCLCHRRSGLSYNSMTRLPTQPVRGRQHVLAMFEGMHMTHPDQMFAAKVSRWPAWKCRR